MFMLLAAMLTAAPVDPLHDLLPETRREIEQVRAAVERYRDFRVAEREGWTKFGGDAPLMGEHWSLDPKMGGCDYIANMPIDYACPSNLMYSWIDGERVLTGVSFNYRLREGERLPDGFAGDHDQFHVHDFPKAVRAALQDRPLLRAIAPLFVPGQFLKTDGGDGRGRLAMVHVWVTMPNPDGPFASNNRLVPYRKLGLPDQWADHGDMDAARGLNLATQNGCTEQIDGHAWIANLSRKKKRALHRACDAAAERIAQALSRRDAYHANAVAAQEWRWFDGYWNSTLTVEEAERIDAMSDHGNHGHHPHKEHGSGDAPMTMGHDH